MIEIGLSGALHIREERLSARDDACRLLYVSDIHLRNGRSDMLSRQVVDAAARCRPDQVLLGGDLVDRPSELDKLSGLVRALCEFAPVLAVGGNHDRRLGMSRVRDAVVDGGGRWIHDRIARVTHGGRVIAVFGPDNDGPRRRRTSASSAPTIRESGGRRAGADTTSYSPGICMAASWSPANIGIACSQARSSIPTAFSVTSMDRHAWSSAAASPISSRSAGAARAKWCCAMSEAIRSSLVAFTCLVRGLPLFFSAAPRTTLRALGVIALDMLHVLRTHSRYRPGEPVSLPPSLTSRDV